MDQSTKTLLASVSRNTEAIGRRIRSPKNGKEDFEDLIKALEATQKTLKTIVRTNFK